MKSIAPLILIAFLGACSSAPELPDFRPLPNTVGKQTKSIETVLSIPQKSLSADIVRATTDERVTAPLVGGIGTGIFKLIDLGVNHSRTATAKEALAPVLASLKLNVNEVMRVALQKELQTVPWAGNGPVSVDTSDDDDILASRYTHSRHAGFLSVAYEYKLSPRFDSLIVEATAQLFPNSVALRRIQAGLYPDTTHVYDPKADKIQIDNALYAQKIFFTFRAPQKLADLNANAAQWASNDGELVRKALNDAASAVAAVIAKSLNNPQALNAQKVAVLIPQEKYSIDINGSAYVVGQSRVGPGAGTTYVAASATDATSQPPQPVVAQTTQDDPTQAP